VEVRRDAEAGESVSSVRLVVEEADATLPKPKVMEVLDGADVRSVGIPETSFNEVFFRLVKETSEKS
jgi:hypothetical protein